MQIGLIGAQGSGKSTIFNSLVGQSLGNGRTSGSKGRSNQVVVNVLDPRIDFLYNLYKPKKKIYAKIEFLDFIGLNTDFISKNSQLGDTISKLKNVDAFTLVINNFSERVDIQSVKSQIEKVNNEIILSDLIIIENRLKNITLSKKRGQNLSLLKAEEELFIKLANLLNQEMVLGDIELSENEKKLISGFQFLSMKPILVIINSDETNFGKSENIISDLPEFDIMEVTAKYEQELSNIPYEETKIFMDDIGIKSPVLKRVTTFLYAKLGYISFFTVGKDEVRAWTIKKGTNAKEAAGKIHSDIQRGFIRAECFYYQNILEFGSERTIREKGLFRLEGKNYIIDDGEVINFRFNV